jgi:hypothetical protein
VGRGCCQREFDEERDAEEKRQPIIHANGFTPRLFPVDGWNSFGRQLGRWFWLRNPGRKGGTRSARGLILAAAGDGFWSWRTREGTSRVAGAGFAGAAGWRLWGDSCSFFSRNIFSQACRDGGKFFRMRLRTGQLTQPARYQSRRAARARKAMRIKFSIILLSFELAEGHAARPARAVWKSKAPPRSWRSPCRVVQILLSHRTIGRSCVLG